MSSFTAQQIADAGIAEAVRVYVRDSLAAGTDPDSIEAHLDKAIHSEIKDWARQNGWSLYGNDEWRIETACSICGSAVPGICGHENDPLQTVLAGVPAVEAHKRARAAHAEKRAGGPT